MSHARYVCLVAGLSAVAALPPALACNCSQPPPLDKWIPAFLAGNSALRPVCAFRGTVTSIEVGPIRKTVGFRVDEWWGKQVAEVVEVETGLSDADCGVPFAQGEEWLVYATSYRGGPWYTSICYPTTDRIGWHTGYLGPGHPITHSPAAVWWSVTATVVACAVLAGMRSARNRNNHRPIDATQGDHAECSR